MIRNRKKALFILDAFYNFSEDVQKGFLPLTERGRSRQRRKGVGWWWITGDGCGGWRKCHYAITFLFCRHYGKTHSPLVFHQPTLSTFASDDPLLLISSASHTQPPFFAESFRLSVSVLLFYFGFLNHRVEFEMGLRKMVSLYFDAWAERSYVESALSYIRKVGSCRHLRTTPMWNGRDMQMISR